MTSGMTPLYFKGSEGATIKPFIPSQTRASQKSSEQLSSQLFNKSSHVGEESQMSRVDLSNAKDSEEFAFMKYQD